MTCIEILSGFFIFVDDLHSVLLCFIRSNVQTNLTSFFGSSIFSFAWQSAGYHCELKPETFLKLYCLCFLEKTIQVASHSLSSIIMISLMLTQRSKKSFPAIFRAKNEKKSLQSTCRWSSKNQLINKHCLPSKWKYRWTKREVFKIISGIHLNFKSDWALAEALDSSRFFANASAIA